MLYRQDQSPFGDLIGLNLNRWPVSHCEPQATKYSLTGHLSASVGVFTNGHFMLHNYVSCNIYSIVHPPVNPSAEKSDWNEPELPI